MQLRFDLTGRSLKQSAVACQTVFLLKVYVKPILLTRQVYLYLLRVRRTTIVTAQLLFETSEQMSLETSHQRLLLMPVKGRQILTLGKALLSI